MFPKVNPKQSFPRLEEEILNYWKENDTFKKSISSRSDAEEFNFYDGPPFATGTPHYGHILAGTIKDVIPRYQTMLGKKVERNFGWDCHGLPIENIVEKKLEISGKEDIENKIGIHTFNETCRANVFGYVDEWKKTVKRMGRWVDMDNDYKTMDTNFMESIWSVFKNIYDKGLIYEGNRVVPYCPRCTTPLSNFEVNQGYKDKQSKTVTVKFKVKSDTVDIPYYESTGIIIRNKKGEVLFGKRKTNGLLTLAGGKLENGENPMIGAIRELEEETGIKISHLDLFSCNYSTHNEKNWKEYVYILDIDEKTSISNPEIHKFEHWKFYDLSKLENNQLESYDHQIIEQLQGKKETHRFHTNGHKYILAWTTTPWTLYANLGLAVGEDIDYVELLDETNGDTYIMARDKVQDYYKKSSDYLILREYKGKCLVGIKYEPIFSDFDIQINEMGFDFGANIKLGRNSWSVVIGHHVTTETGTGVVHIAPAYGEDDFIIGEKENLGFVAHIDDSGKTYNLLEKNGQFVFDFNETVIAELKSRKLSLHIGTIVHSYPHCWRCDTPLIYRGIGAWYVAVEQIRDKMVANNEKILWVPETIKHGRFGKWIENARDWNISRNRYWGSAIPVWQSEDKKEEVCIGSIEELYQKNKEFGQITKVILVRHGRTDYNEQKKEDSEGRAKLNEKGLSQAQELVNVFKDEKVDVIYSSPLERCVNTITPLASELGKEIHIVDSLREVNIGNLNGHSSIDWKYFRENKDVKIGGGEAYDVMSKRLIVAYKDIISKNNGKTIIICTHGDPSYNILSHILGFEVGVTLDKSIALANKTENIHDIYSVRYVYSSSGKEVDLHKHFVDGIFVKHPKTGNTLKRTPEVLDCWFESGAMPYASKHYPFENKENFKFPADFIAEGIDQTRGWFYTLLILGTALFDNTPFLNCIVNGTVLAEDGKKMSKRLQNYPDPQKIFDTYGADAMRFYLMDSAVVEAQDMRFSESGVEEVVKKVILPLWNTYSFFTTYANIDRFIPTGKYERKNPLDIWIFSELNTLINEMNTHLGNYKIADATKQIPVFMDTLTNWYVRRSRKRFWKSDTDSDKLEAYETLYEVLVTLSKVIAPFMPFISEYIYRALTKNESVHLDFYPLAQKKLINTSLNKSMDTTKKIISLGLSWRSTQKIRVRQPLSLITIGEKLDAYYLEIIKEELNVKKVEIIDTSKIAKKICKPNGRTIGPKFGSDVKFIMSEAKSGNFRELGDGKVKVGEFILDNEDFEIAFETSEGTENIESGFGMVIAMDGRISEELRLEGYARDIVRQIQEARKEANYEVDNRIDVSIKSDNEDINKSIQLFSDYINLETLSSLVNEIVTPDIEKVVTLDDVVFTIKLKK